MHTIVIHSIVVMSLDILPSAVTHNLISSIHCYCCKTIMLHIYVKHNSHIESTLVAGYHLSIFSCKRVCLFDLWCYADRSVCLHSIGHHAANGVQGWQVASLQADQWDDDQAPGSAPQQWFPGALVPHHAQGLHQQWPGIVSRWHYSYTTGCVYAALDGLPVKLISSWSCLNRR